MAPHCPNTARLTEKLTSLWSLHFTIYMWDDRYYDYVWIIRHASPWHKQHVLLCLDQRGLWCNHQHATRDVRWQSAQLPSSPYSTCESPSLASSQLGCVCYYVLALNMEIIIYNILSKHPCAAASAATRLILGTTFHILLGMRILCFQHIPTTTVSSPSDSHEDTFGELYKQWVP